MQIKVSFHVGSYNERPVVGLQIKASFHVGSYNERQVVCVDNVQCIWLQVPITLNLYLFFIT